MCLSTDLTYHRWIKYLFCLLCFPPLYYFVCSPGTLSCEKSITQEHRKLFGNKKRLLWLYGAQWMFNGSRLDLWTQQCVLEQCTNCGRKRRPHQPTLLHSHTASKCSCRHLSHGCDLHHVHRVFCTCVVVHEDVGVNSSLTTVTHYTALKVTLSRVSLFSLLKRLLKTRKSTGVILLLLLLCELSASLDSLSVL